MKNKDKYKKEENSLTLAKIVCNWYIGAMVGFAVGISKESLATAVIGTITGAVVSWLFRMCLLSKK